MTVLVAKPYINNNKDLKEFTNKKDAIAYLNSYLPDDYPTMAFEDYALIGKLFAKDGTDIMPKKGKPGRPKKVK
jgi:hypothetical protein